MNMGMPFGEFRDLPT